MIPPHFMENLDDSDVFHSKTEQQQNPMMTTGDYDHVDTEKGDLIGLRPADFSRNLQGYKARKEEESERRKRVEEELEKEETKTKEK